MYDRPLVVSSQRIEFPLLSKKGVTLVVKREDGIHPHMSGNKYRKLKYNLLQARAEGHSTLLSYGGAYSNHIAATAYAGKKANLATIGIIRGEELKNRWQQNPTLHFAYQNGMHFEFVSRRQYREKNKLEFRNSLMSKHGRYYELPEGGTNALAVKGCEEILTEEDSRFDVICTCVGTGGTIAGLINTSFAHQEVLGFQVVRGDFLTADIRNFAKKENWRLIADYHFGGYAKVSNDLVQFMNVFKEKTQIQLDPIYTGKLFYGLLDMIEKNQFDPGTKILAIHTGGLQGIAGMNALLKKKKLPLIDV